MDKAAGALVVDRFLFTPMRYSGNYGFVPHTLSDDGDPIDVLVANTRPIMPSAIINVCPVGALQMLDEAGSDEKIIAVPSPKVTQRYVGIQNYADLPPITIEQIQHLFGHYKDGVTRPQRVSSSLKRSSEQRGSRSADLRQLTMTVLAWLAMLQRLVYAHRLHKS